jgi:uncharacterized protein with PIN domain
MNQLTIRFYAELNDFLLDDQKQIEIQHAFRGRPSIKDLIESLGVPHTEVDVILVDGQSVSFSHQIVGGERISVYPTFESLDVRPVLRLRPEPLRQSKFVLDVHLGKLASYLRLAGFDSLYHNDSEDAELAKTSFENKRILLTKDRGLLKRKDVTHGYLVREVHPRHQLLEVFKRFDLFKSVRPFHRCMRCNGLIESVEKELILTKIPSETQEHYHHFKSCTDCHRVYWKGPHYRRMNALLESVLAHADDMA